MKYLLYFSAFIVILSCTRPPELDDTPQISFENIAFREASNNQELILDIYFQDGDGDLGLRPEETFPPYNRRNEMTDEFGEVIQYSKRNEIDTLPLFNVKDWWVIRDPAEDNKILDTIYAPLHPNHFNIFVNFYVIENDEPKIFDFSEELNVLGYDGRFPILFDDINNERALEGSLRYKMESSGWQDIFSIDSLQLEVYIQDRALNKSNTITTPRFTLQGIKIN
ncbi:MAG: hypothetical protein ACOCXH_08775 [Cyclobacteriaceae bacterium]